MLSRGARARFCADLLSKDYKTGKSTVELKTKTPAGLVRAAATRPAGEPPGNPNRASVCADAHAEWQQERQGRILRQPRAQVPGDERRRGDRHAQHVGLGRRTCEATDLLTKGLVANSRRPRRRTEGCFKALATFDFKQELFTAKASYEVYKGDAHAALSTAALAGTTLGGSVDYS